MLVCGQGFVEIALNNRVGQLAQLFINGLFEDGFRNHLQQRRGGPGARSTDVF